MVVCESGAVMKQGFWFGCCGGNPCEMVVEARVVATVDGGYNLGVEGAVRRNSQYWRTERLV